jgi:two-component system, sporulation sensor kinase B
MLNYYRDLILNVLLIFLPIALYGHVFKANRAYVYNRVITCLLFGITIIATMSFPVKIYQSTFDFRGVSIAIGSLYGGAYVSLFLYAVVIVYRFLMGNPNQMAYILALVPTFFVSLLFIRNFQTFSLIQKIISSVIVYFMVRVFTLAVYYYLTNNVNALVDYTAPLIYMTILFQCFISGCYVYILEVFHKNSRLRDEIMKSEKIKIVSEIAASVAHEVRNPLTSVRGFIQLMGKDELSKENRQYYQKICLEELDRAQQIISDYLTFAKPEPEKIEVIDIKSEIDYITNVLISYANYQNVQILKQLPEEQLLVVGDKYKLRQALMNIGKNGIEAMPEGGLLTFIVHKMNQFAMISIVDTGIGMTKDQINRLGTPYYSTKEKGTGLGTMVSFSIIREMQGKVEVKSEQGKGTTHIISLDLVI